MLHFYKLYYIIKFRVKENANKLINALLAHLVEHLTLNRGCAGFEPPGGALKGTGFMDV